MADKKIEGSLQENILVLLCFDKDSAGFIRDHITVDLFDSVVYRTIANHAIGFLDLYKAPIAEHLPDFMEDVLYDKDKNKVDLYKDILDNLYESKDTINKDYVLSQLKNFIDERNLTVSLSDAQMFIEQGDIEGAQSVLLNSMKVKADTFDAGVFFGKEMIKTLEFLDHQNDFIHTGIQALD